MNTIILYLILGFIIANSGMFDKYLDIIEINKKWYKFLITIFFPIVLLWIIINELIQK